MTGASAFKDNGVDTDVPDSAYNSEEGEGGGDTAGVDTVGVDADVCNALASRGRGRSGVEVNVTGASAPGLEGEIGDNCAGIDVFFEGEEQEGVSGSTAVAELCLSSQWRTSASMTALMNALSSFSSCPGLSLGWFSALCNIGGKYCVFHCPIDKSYSGCPSDPVSALSNSALGTTGKILSGNQESVIISPL